MVLSGAGLLEVRIPKANEMNTPEDKYEEAAEAALGDSDRGKSRGKRLVNKLNLGPDHKFDYKDPQILKYFLTERGKIVPRRVSGLSARQQRDLALAIKRARNIALVPFTRSKP